MKCLWRPLSPAVKYEACDLVRVQVNPVMFMFTHAAGVAEGQGVCYVLLGAA